MVSYSFEGNKRLWTVRDEEQNEKIFGQKSMPTGVQIPNDIKSTYLANSENNVEKWPLVDLMRLLRFYAAHRCLWDVDCKHNRNRQMRHAAIVDITAAMGTGVSKKQVVQKINILKATYRYEKKRIKQRIRQGLGARTKLKWFALADAFLRNIPKKARKEETSNSDSELEDTIVFSINPESLLPLEPEFSSEIFEEYKESIDAPSETKQEIPENSYFHSATLERERIEDFDSLKTQYFPIKIVRDEDYKIEDKQLKIDHIQNLVKKKNWTFEDTIKFLQLLQVNTVLENNSFKSCELPQTTLKSIARHMNYSHKSIKKRWIILQKTVEEESKKILENSDYKPKYKWWPEAEKVFVKISKPKVMSNILNIKNVPTEIIFLSETKNGECNEHKEYEKIFLEIPIPSVAPLSNLDKAISSLFSENYNGTLSQELNTNCSYLKENETLSTDKFVLHGLEENLLEGKWSLKQSVKFLRLYGAHRCLWDLNDPDYRSRPLRNAALEDIAGYMGHGLTTYHVGKKIKIFRITYMQQRKRLLEATEKGEKPEILLKWFPLADSFLRHHIGLRSIKSDAKEMPQFDYQYVYANLNLIDPALLTDFHGKGTQNTIEIGNDSDIEDMEGD